MQLLSVSYMLHMTNAEVIAWTYSLTGVIPDIKMRERKLDFVGHVGWEEDCWSKFCKDWCQGQRQWWVWFRGVADWMGMQCGTLQGYVKTTKHGGRLLASNSCVCCSLWWDSMVLYATELCTYVTDFQWDLCMLIRCFWKSCSHSSHSEWEQELESPWRWIPSLQNKV